MLAPLLAARPGPTQWRLAGIDCDAGIAVTLVRGEAVLLVEIEARDEARACYARTARFNVNARRAFAPGDLDTDERRFVLTVAQQVAQALERARLRDER